MEWQKRAGQLAYCSCADQRWWRFLSRAIEMEELARTGSYLEVESSSENQLILFI